MLEEETQGSFSFGFPIYSENSDVSRVGYYEKTEFLSACVRRLLTVI